MSARDFQTVVDCVPGIGSELTPRDLVSAQAQSVGDGATGSVVFIETNTGGVGSGFFISASGLIMTNNHVVSGSDSFTIWLEDGRTFQAELVGSELIPDVAVLQMIDPPAGLVPLQLGSSTALKAGDTLVTIGHPQSIGNWVVTVGEFLEREETQLQLVASIDPEMRVRDVTNLVASVPGSKGNSGSPALDMQGRVVGVVYAGEDRNPIKSNGAPHVSSADVHEFIVVTQIALIVPIEDALEVVAQKTGDQSFLPDAASDSTPASTAELTPEVLACVTPVLGGGADAFLITASGLPDFSGMDGVALTPTGFSTVIGCIPGLTLTPSPVLRVEAAQQPVFSADVLERAQAVVDASRSAVLFLNLGGEAIATGFLISDDGLIMTNQHNVVGVENSVTAWTIDGRSYEATFLGAVSQPDIALLRIEAPSGIEPLRLGTSVDLATGDRW